VRVLMVSAVMLVTLFGVACGSTGSQGSTSQDSSDAVESAASEDTKSQTTQQQSKSNASSQQTYRNLSIGDTAIFNYDDTVTVYSYTSPAQPANNIWTPAPGTQYAAIDVEGCAGDVEVTDAANTQMTFNPFSFTLQMLDNTRLQPTVGVVEPVLVAVSLPPEDCLRGSVSFEVPQGQTPSYVIFTKPSQESARWAIE
jgi:hypothetical protein